MREIIGVIYPIPVDFVDRLFDGKPKVFIKYLAHSSTRLVPNHKVIFYASRGPKKLVGEGIIEKVEFLTPEEVLSTYRNKLPVSEAELHKYVTWISLRDASKEMLTLSLRKLRRYPVGIDYGKPMTMAGKYLSHEEYNLLMKHKQR